jgi:bacillithiol system protein YtxJ
VERPLRLKTMNWIHLDSEEKLAEATTASLTKPVVLFKHSTTCSISNTALNRLERNWKNEEVAGTQTYYLDLLSYRQLSRQIAENFQVAHQSPQVLIIQNEKSVYDTSHFDINYPTIKAEIEKLLKK